MINLIAINGRIGSGKDTVGRIIQFLVARSYAKDLKTIAAYDKQGISDDLDYTYTSGWEIRKFAGKLKQIASLLTGIPVDKFEDQEFKRTYLGEEWNYPTNFTVYGNKPTGKSGYVQMTVRELLQKLGTDAIRNHLHENAWVNATFSDYYSRLVPNVDENNYPLSTGGVKQSYPKWILTDCRFPNEAQAVKDRGGIVIRVNRDKWERYTDTQGIITEIKVGPIDLHPSETALDSWNFDWEIDNDDSLDILIRKVKEMLLHFGILTKEMINN